MLTLFTHFNVPCGHKVQLFLHELSIPYNIHPINLRDNEHQSTWFLKMNPKAQVPVLLDDTTVICDSTKICVYLDKKFSIFPTETTCYQNSFIIKHLRSYIIYFLLYTSYYLLSLEV